MNVFQEKKKNEDSRALQNDGRKVTELTEYTGQKLHVISKMQALAFTFSVGPKMTLLTQQGTLLSFLNCREFF